jgi:hypothetical protein
MLLIHLFYLFSDKQIKVSLVSLAKLFLLIVANFSQDAPGGSKIAHFSCPQ